MLQSLISQALAELAGDVQSAIPRIAAGLIFFAVAAVGIKVIMFFVRQFLRRALPGDSTVYRQFIATIVAVFLWFGVILSTLSVVGLTIIAASLGTGAGFLALGVSYALSGMIADAVSGVYLLRDPDFQPGDTVTIGDVTGEVRAIELRKTRLAVEGDVVVRANADIEKQWRKVGGDVESQETVIR